MRYFLNSIPSDDDELYAENELLPPPDDMTLDEELPPPPPDILPPPPPSPPVQVMLPTHDIFDFDTLSIKMGIHNTHCNCAYNHIPFICVGFVERLSMTRV